MTFISLGNQYQMLSPLSGIMSCWDYQYKVWCPLLVDTKGVWSNTLLKWMCPKITMLKATCSIDGVYFQRQEMTASTETLDCLTDSAPQALPYHSNTSTLRSIDSPKREATEMYLKSKALLESRRKWRQTQLEWFSEVVVEPETVIPLSTEPHTKDIDVFLKRDIETGFGFRVLGGEGPQQPVSIYDKYISLF